MTLAKHIIPPMLFILLPGPTTPAAPPAPKSRISLSFDASEAEAVLQILDQKALGKPIAEADWQRLFATEPYKRLKQREAAMHREFTDEEFKAFVLSPELAKRSQDLRRTLEAWRNADLKAAASRVLAYLPAQARIRAKVFPMIKPKPNSFVFEPATDPAVFLYLDPAVPGAEFENTVAHEMHHIGFASLGDGMEAGLRELPPPTRTAVEWISAFGEGFAMLAAAGGPHLHPRATSKAEDRARWDRDMANVNADLKAVEAFLLDVLQQKLKTKDEIDAKAYSFFGVQGPWYTVGYRMAVAIEQRFGRAVLVECMANPRKLLPTYNRAATELNGKGAEPLALWSPELVAAVEGKKP